MSVSCWMGPKPVNSFFCKKSVSFNDKKLEAKASDGSWEYAQDPLRTICETAMALGVNPVLIVKTWEQNDMTGEKRNEKIKRVKWTGYLKSEGE